VAFFVAETQKATCANGGFGDHRGLYLIGDKKTGRITDVRVVDHEGHQQLLPFVVYAARGVEPNYRTLPWQEDIRETASPSGRLAK
jgi:hypothetical protein